MRHHCARYRGRGLLGHGKFTCTCTSHVRMYRGPPTCHVGEKKRKLPTITSYFPKLKTSERVRESAVAVSFRRTFVSVPLRGRASTTCFSPSGRISVIDEKTQHTHTHTWSLMVEDPAASSAPASPFSAAALAFPWTPAPAPPAAASGATRVAAAVGGGAVGGGGGVSTGGAGGGAGGSAVCEGREGGVAGKGGDTALRHRKQRRRRSRNAWEHILEKDALGIQMNGWWIHGTPTASNFVALLLLPLQPATRETGARRRQ